MAEILLLILGLLLFSSLIVLHEYGHFLVAKRNGVKVKEFGLGFPPKLVGREMGKGIFKGYYTLNLLPIGGFVRLEGENDAAEGEDSYGGKSLWAKTKIILAGVGVNFLIAAVLFTVLSWIGIPKLLPAGSFEEEQFALASDTEIVEDKTLVSFVFEGSPAGDAGIEVGDEVVSLTDQGTGRVHPIEDGDRLWELTAELAGKRVGVLTLRDGEERLYNLALQTEEEAEATDTGRLGVSTSDFVIQRHTWSAPINGIVLTAQYAKVTLQGLGQAIGYLLVGDAGTAKDSVTGPIGIFFVLQAGAEYGLSWILMIIALLSLALAIINSLPIPALDGGRLALTLLFRKVLRRPLTKRLEDRIVGFSMVGLLALMVLVAVIDIERFLL